jgi:predicted nucleic-acid-binding protein
VEEQVLDTIGALLQTGGVTIESRSIAWKALEACEWRHCGFVDQLIAEISFESGVGEIITFDKAFNRRPGVRRPKQYKRFWR